MVKTSKIDIFNVMTEEELEDTLKNSDYSRREYRCNVLYCKWSFTQKYS